MKQQNNFLFFTLLCVFSVNITKANEAIAKNRQEQMAAVGFGDFLKTVVNGVLDIGRPVWGSYKVES